MLEHNLYNANYKLIINKLQYDIQNILIINLIIDIIYSLLYYVVEVNIAYQEWSRDRPDDTTATCFM